MRRQHRFHGLPRPLVSGPLLLLLAAGGAYQFAEYADATGVPATEPLFYGGTIERDGRPVEGEHAVTINIWGPTSGEGVDGELLCAVEESRTELRRGHFRIALPDDCVAAVTEHSEVRTEVLFEGESLGRDKTHAAPFAAQAQRARFAEVANLAEASRGDFDVPGALEVTGDVSSPTSALGSTGANWLQVGGNALNVTDGGVDALHIEVSPNGLSPNISSIRTILPATDRVTMRANGNNAISIRADVLAATLTVEGDALFDVGPTVTTLRASQVCTPVGYLCPGSALKGFPTDLGVAFAYCARAPLPSLCNTTPF